jgi:excinuclease ABC subunit C
MSESDFSSPAFDPDRFLPGLPEGPGVYRMIGADEQVLYVGKAKNLKKRVSSYFRKPTQSPRIALMLSRLMRIDITGTRSEAEALLLENNLIKTLSPRYNILFRDDKTYPYIAVSGHTFPRLGFHRGRFDAKSRYFGPFPNVQAVRECLHILEKTFLLRTCEDSVFAHRSRPCLLYQIQRCSGPCVGKITESDYTHTVEMASLFLQGQSDAVLQQLSDHMQAKADSLDFEGAALLRDRIRQLQSILHRQYMEGAGHEDTDLLLCVHADGTFCVNLAMIRAGRHLGDQPHFPSMAGSSTPEEVLLAFIEQHYATHPAPPRLLLALMEAEATFPLTTLLEELPLLPGIWPQTGVVFQAPRKTHEKAWQEMALKNARWAIGAHRQRHDQQIQRLQELADVLRLESPPRRIECFDISHTQGEATQASCVSCLDGQMRTSLYRRYRIRDITPGDDPGAMRQVLQRRYSAMQEDPEAALWPDLILIDGGKMQVRAACDVLEGLGLHALMVLGVAKGEDRKPGLETLVWPDERPSIELDPRHPALLLIQEIRDEAHRFAITGHRAQRAKVRKRSRLEDIPGIGPARRKALLVAFGGLEGVKSASVEDLCRVDGIHRRLAEQIYCALH